MPPKKTSTSANKKPKAQKAPVLENGDTAGPVPEQVKKGARKINYIAKAEGAIRKAQREVTKNPNFTPRSWMHRHAVARYEVFAQRPNVQDNGKKSRSARISKGAIETLCQWFGHEISGMLAAANVVKVDQHPTKVRLDGRQVNTGVKLAYKVPKEIVDLHPQQPVATSA